MFADFKFMFKTTDHDALIRMWPQIEKKPYEKFRITLDRQMDAYHRDVVLHNMLTFVKLFQTHKYKFERSVDSLIVFSDVIQSRNSDVIRFTTFIQ